MVALTSLETAQAIRAKKMTAVEAVCACLDAVAKIDGKINAFLSVNAE